MPVSNCVIQSAAIASNTFGVPNSLNRSDNISALAPVVNPGGPPKTNSSRRRKVPGSPVTLDFSTGAPFGIASVRVSRTTFSTAREVPPSSKSNEIHVLKTFSEGFSSGVPDTTATVFHSPPAPRAQSKPKRSDILRTDPVAIASTSGNTSRCMNRQYSPKIEDCMGVQCATHSPVSNRFVRKTRPL